MPSRIANVLVSCAFAIFLVGVCGSTPVEASQQTSLQTKVSANLVQVRHDRGGNVIEYMRDVTRLRMSATRVEISGRCDSACTLLLSLPPELLCIRDNANFGFHKAYGASRDMNEWATDMMWKSYPIWVKDWLKARGGMRDGVIRMGYSRASAHLRECDNPVRNAPTS